MTQRQARVHTVDDFRDYEGRTWREYRPILAELVRYLDPGPILDIGAGLGLFVECCQRLGLTAVGVEGSPYAVERAVARAQLAMILHRCEQPLPFVDRSFAAVVLNQTIEHLAPATATVVLGEAFRVLQPGGVLLIDSPCVHDPVQRAEETHVNLYTPRRLRQEITAAGFEVLLEPNDPRPLLGSSTWGRRLVGIALRASGWDRLAQTANLRARKPLVDRQSSSTKPVP